MNRLKNSEEKTRQVYLSQNWQKTKSLYFVANSASMVKNTDVKMLRGVADSYLTKTISYSKEDGAIAIKSFAFYKTRFSQETVDNRGNMIRTGDYMIYFKPLIAPKTKSGNLFVLP